MNGATGDPVTSEVEGPILKDTYRYWLYEYEHPDAASVLYHLDSVLRQHPKVKLNVVIASSVFGLNERFQSSTREGFEARVNGNSNIFRLRIEKKGEIEEGVPAVGDVLGLRFGDTPVYVLISDHVTQFVKSVLGPFLNSYYPDVSRVYLSSVELFLLLRRLQEKSEGKILIDRLTAYSRLKATHRQNRTEVTYTEEPFGDIFKRLLENDQWVDKIRFSLFASDGSYQMSGYLSRYGFFRCKNSFSIFYQTAITDAVKMASRKLRAFANRNRSAEQPTPQKLEIDYEYDIFQAKEQMSRLIEAIASMKFTSMSIYHRNPYLHVSVLDYLDGSSYDVWVVTANKIHIVPQIQASAASLARLVNHVFESFREGNIEGYASSSEIALR